jgi:hypothetical protein
VHTHASDSGFAFPAESIFAGGAVEPVVLPGMQMSRYSIVLVLATLRLIERALEDLAVTRLVLLSESCAPIRSFRYVTLAPFRAVADCATSIPPMHSARTFYHMHTTCIPHAYHMKNACIPHHCCH